MEGFVYTIPRGLKRRAPSDKKSSGILNFRGPKQMFLDFGQKKFRINTACSRCGMVYVADILEDSVQHNMYCLELSGERIPFKPSSFCRSNTYFEDKDRRIIEIRRDPASSNFPASIASSILRIQLTMGNTEDFDKSAVRAYFYVVEGFIVGAAFVETVPEDSIVQITKTKTTFQTMTPSIFDDDKENMLLLDNKREKLENATKCKLFLGVRLLWVHPAHRRRKVASDLIDVARKTFAYGSEFAFSRVAFSQPTSDGLAFARSYIDGQEENIATYT